MKIVFASTPGQEKKVEELAQYFYSEILPLYFNDEDILKFEELKVLHTSREDFDNFSTLGEAFRVITSLQTVISILETKKNPERYKPVFQKNAETLREYGINFPFDYNQFLEAKRNNPHNQISIFTRAANSILA